MIRLSLAARYALEGMRDLARHYGAGYLRAEQAARRRGLPAEFLSKIFSRLAARSLLESRRGPGGGFALRRAPEAVRVGEILAALELPGRGADHCLLGHRFCGRGNPCPVHETVAAMERTLLARLRAMSLAELAGPTEP